MNNFMKRLFVEPLERFYDNVLQYLPNIMSFLLIMISGMVLGKLLRVVFMHAFRLIQLDRFSEKTGIHAVLLKGGIKDNLSILLSRLAGWGTVFVFIIIALNVLEVPEVEHLLRTFFLYLPNVLVAMIILFVGYFLGNFLGRAALIAAVNSDIRMSGAIGRFVKFTVFVMSVTMALEQLGIGRETTIIAFSIIFGGVVFALALALGLGGRDLAKEYLEQALGKKKEQPRKDDDIHHI